MLQDALNEGDWDMSRTRADTINEFADVPIGFVSLLENDIVSESETLG